MVDSPPSPGARLRALRVATGVSMKGVASAADCNWHHLQMIETGHRRPSPELAARLAKALTDISGRTVEVAEFFDNAAPRRAA